MEKRPRKPIGRTEIEAFLPNLAVQQNVAATTQNYVFGLSQHTPSALCCSRTARCWNR